MVAGYHLIWTAYGCWLPNDPRGSTSHELRVDILKELGQLHFGRKKVQPCASRLREFYERAEPLLRHAILTISDADLAVVADGFGQIMKRHRYTCYACAIMPDHVHVLIRKHRHLAEDMIENLQNESRDALIKASCRKAVHPVWARHGWKVYLDSRDEIERTIRYIRANPLKAGRPEQTWPFVVAYDGWLPGGQR